MNRNPSAASAANSTRTVAAKRRREAKNFVSSELARIQKDEKSIHVAATKAAEKGMLPYEKAYAMCAVIIYSLDRLESEGCEGGAA